MPGITLRLTEEQHATLVAAAADNGRSLQREIIFRLFPRRLAALSERGVVGGSPPLRSESAGSGAAEDPASSAGGRARVPQSRVTAPEHFKPHPKPGKK